MRTEATQKPLILCTSRSLAAGHRVWNAAEHFETGSVFCVQNKTGTSHLKGLLSPGRLLTWRFTREHPALIQYKYQVLHNTCNIITLIFIKDKQSLASKNTCVYICSSERASVSVSLRSRRISTLQGCIWIIFEALTRVQIYIKRWKCIPPREACDKKPYWNSMREIFFFSFLFFSLRRPKVGHGIMGKYFANNCLPNASNLDCPDYTKQREAHIISMSGGGGGNVWSRQCRMWIRRRGMETEALSWASSRLFEWSFTFPHPRPLMHRRGQGSRAHVSHLDSFSLLFQQWDTRAAVPAVGPQTHPLVGPRTLLGRSNPLVKTPWKFVTACRWLAL